jgi:dCTP deaminase
MEERNFKRPNSEFMEKIPDPKTSLLSDKAILRNIENGKIIIDPFNIKNLGTNSYDVCLGDVYFREQINDLGSNIYNLYSQEEVSRIWGKPQKAENAGEWMKKTGIKLENIFDDDEIIFIEPGETILAITQEFIGGKETITTGMHARSSFGRNFIEVCKCAGLGDTGFINRWVMEITSNSRRFTMPLVVGRRIAQIMFWDTEGTLKSYESNGKYQISNNIEELKKSWIPDIMLPKLYRDYEIAEKKQKNNKTL